MPLTLEGIDSAPSGIDSTPPETGAAVAAVVAGACVSPPLGMDSDAAAVVSVGTAVAGAGVLPLGIDSDAAGSLFPAGAAVAAVVSVGTAVAGACVVSVGNAVAGACVLPLGMDSDAAGSAVPADAVVSTSGAAVSGAVVSTSSAAVSGAAVVGSVPRHSTGPATDPTAVWLEADSPCRWQPWDISHQVKNIQPSELAHRA